MLKQILKITVIIILSGNLFCQNQDLIQKKLYEGINTIDFSYCLFTNESSVFSLTNTNYRTLKLTPVSEPIFGCTFIYNRNTKSLDISSNLIFDILYEINICRKILLYPIVIPNMKANLELGGNYYVILGQKTDYFLFRKKPTLTTHTILGLNYIQENFILSLESRYSWINSLYSDDFQLNLIFGISIGSHSKFSRVFPDYYD